MVTRHNMIRDILVEICHQAHIGVKVEVGNNLSRDHSKTRPADILLPNWFLDRTTALDVSTKPCYFAGSGSVGHSCCLGH